MNDLPAAIFFDLDDTIIDDSANVNEGWQLAIEHEASAFDGLEAQRVLAAVLEVRDWYWADAERHRIGRADLRRTSGWIAGEALRRLGYEDPAVAARIGHHYRDLREAARALFPGAIEALERVRELGIRTALLTNGDALGQRAKVVQFDLLRYFDYICIEGEFGCGKPDERVYRSALQSVKTAPETTWMVGDNLEWDVAAPMRQGISGIWLDRFEAGLPETAAVKPDRVILAIRELLESS